MINFFVGVLKEVYAFRVPYPKQLPFNKDGSKIIITSLEIVTMLGGIMKRVLMAVLVSCECGSLVYVCPCAG